MTDPRPATSDADLTGWIGRSESTSDTVTPQLAQRLAATLGSTRTALAKGNILPQGWYGVLFPRVVPRSQIGADGHPALGDFLPPVALPKRMFAGKRISFVAPIVIGDELERTSEIAAIQPKQGKTGKLVFVTLRHTVRSADGVKVIEEQDVVYREASSGAAKRPETEAFTAQDESPVISADPVMIFRYSALCFNGHRIHYDQPYATQVEGYPALVVNGGLTAMCALEHLHQRWGKTFASLTVRNTAPLFEGEAFRVLSHLDAAQNILEFRVVTTGGKNVVAGQAVLEEAAA